MPGTVALHATDTERRPSMKHVSILSRNRLMDDFFRVDELHLQFELFDGSMSEPVRRLLMDRGDAVAAVVWNRDSRKIVLVEQFRVPTLEKGTGWLVELPAGLVDEGERPEACIVRELEEETGYRPESIEYITTFYSTPGGSNERVLLYYAEVGNQDRRGAGGGMAGEHEDIRVLEYGTDDVMRLVSGEEVTDSKTLIGLMWWLSRDRGAE